MERLKRMSVFAKVVEFGSFTAAARQLQMSVSSISQTVSKLEDELQVKLLNRSTRSIGLTEAGRIYYGAAVVCFMKCRMFMSNCMPSITPHRDATHWLFFNYGTKCSRRADSQNAERIPVFERQSGYRNSSPDLIADGLDVVIRVGALQDSSLFSRRLGAMPMVVCAAKAISHNTAYRKTRRFE